MQALEPWIMKRNAPYGSVFHWHEDRTRYTEKMLENWSDRELLIKHYHLTARLDGYNHTKGDPEMVEVTSANCLLFRAVLAARGINGVRHCMEMDWWYNAGWRSVKVFYPPLLTS